MQRIYKIARFFAKGSLALVFGAALIWMVVIADQKVVSEHKGLVRVVDGDSLQIGNEKIRIVGIDAPELDQFCSNSGDEWPCGQVAKTVLSDWLDGRAVVCSSKGKDKYRRTLSVCKVDGKDIGKWMVTRGWAVSYGDYVFDEAIARRNRLGLWQGEFELPSDWRRRSELLPTWPNPLQWIKLQFGL